MNDAHKAKKEARRKERQEQFSSNREIRRKEFYEKSCLKKWGITAMQIESMWQGFSSPPENWSWEYYYDWEHNHMAEWDLNNPWS